ncbi:MAG: hypothetical protein KBB83_03505 [Alphaproteobacteria bacterium]|nr:hypothetical protein [Alphaproteobacteria bacterium]
MKKIAIILALVCSVPLQATNEPDLAPRSANATYNYMEENLLYLNHVLVMAEDKEQYQDWVRPVIQAFTEDVSIEYLRLLGYDWKNLPLKKQKAQVLGVVDKTMVTGLGKVRQDFFDENIINTNRTKGFVYGQAIGFTVQPNRADRNQYIISVQLDHQGVATYMGVLNRQNPPKILDLVGPDGRRLSLNLKLGLTAKDVTMPKIYRAFKSLLNIQSKDQHAFFGYKSLSETDVIKNIFVDSRVADGVYSLNFLPQKKSMLREPFTRLEVEDPITHQPYFITGVSFAEVQSINEVWRAKVAYDADDVPQNVNVGPGFEIEFAQDKNIQDPLVNLWFRVKKQPMETQIDLLSRVDWSAVEAGTGRDFGQKYLQTLIKISNLPSYKDSYEMAKEAIPVLVQRLSLMK